MRGQQRGRALADLLGGVGVDGGGAAQGADGGGHGRMLPARPGGLGGGPAVRPGAVAAGGGPLEGPDLVDGQRRATPPASAGGRRAGRCGCAPGAAPGGRWPRTCAGPGGCDPRGSRSAPARARPGATWAGAVRPSSSSTPSRSRRSSARVGSPSTWARYSLSTPKRRVGQAVGQLAVVGQQQQALGVEVEAADREHPGLGGHQVDHRGAALGVVGGGDHAGRLVEQVVDQAGPHPDGGAVDLDQVVRRRRPGARARPPRR